MAREYRYYMPFGTHEFLNWARNFVEVLSAHLGEWGFTAADAAPLAAAVGELSALVALADTEKATRDDYRRKKAFLKDTMRQFRLFVNSRVNWNGRISDAGRAALRVHIRDTVKTAVERPAGHVRFWVSPLGEHGQRVDFIDDETGRKRIPYGYNGAMLRSKVLGDGEPPPLAGGELPCSQLMTGTPFAVEHGPECAGKRVAFAAAWQNKKGQMGEFSDVQVSVVP